MAATPAVCEHLHLPLQAGSDRVLAAMHRGYTADRYLERLAAARAAVADLAVSTDLIVGFPGETDDDFERTLEVVAAAEYDSAYTFIYSPRPGTEAAELADRFVDPATTAARFDRLKVVVERSALAKHRARIGRVEELLIEGPSKKDPSVTSGRTRQNKLVHLRADRPLRPGAYVTAEVTDAAPHHLARPAGRRRGRARPPHAHPGGGGLTTIAIVGPTASGKSALALALARRHPGTELVSVDSMQVYRGMDIGTAKPSAAERAEVPHHGIDLADPSEEVTVVRYQAEARAALAAIEHRGGQAVLVGGTGLYLRALVDRLDPPGEWPATRAELEARPRHRAPPRPPRGARPGGGGQDAADEPAPRPAGPRGHAGQWPALQLLRSRARELPAQRGRPGRPPLAPRRAHGAHRAALRPPARRRLPRRGRRARRQARPACPERPARRSATASCSTTSAVATSLDEAVHLAITRTRQFAVRQERWFRRDPRIRWVDATDDPIAALDLIEQELASCA